MAVIAFIAVAALIVLGLMRSRRRVNRQRQVQEPTARYRRSGEWTRFFPSIDNLTWSGSLTSVVNARSQLFSLAEEEEDENDECAEQHEMNSLVNDYATATLSTVVGEMETDIDAGMEAAAATAAAASARQPPTLTTFR